MSTIEIFHHFDERMEAAARSVLEDSLPPDLVDDRFDGAWTETARSGDFIGAVARRGDAPIGYVGGLLEEHVLRLDALLTLDADPTDLHRLVERVLGKVSATSQPGTNALRVELWAKPTSPAHETVARDHRFDPYRALHQMRCPLPVDPAAVGSSLPTRPFVVGQDEQALIDVNNRAFASHPSQGSMTLSDLDSAAGEPWFNSDGIRMFEIDGDVAGFCWTKIHRNPSLGEIYVIGIDPAHHGQGLGVPMTAAGLDWLADQGLETGMLYVEADNEPALRTYARLGFEIVRTDRAWVRSLTTHDS